MSTSCAPSLDWWTIMANSCHSSQVCFYKLTNSFRNKSNGLGVLHRKSFMQWCQETVNATVFSSASTLCPNKELVLSYEKPIPFASRSLAPAERKYAQLDKEVLAIIFGVTNFTNSYLSGRQFTIYSDHKLLQLLFSEQKPVPAMASARIQQWALTLTAYDYTISYKSGEDHANADVLSRLPLPVTRKNVPVPGGTVQWWMPWIIRQSQLHRWSLRPTNTNSYQKYAAWYYRADQSPPWRRDAAIHPPTKWTKSSRRLPTLG